MSFPEIVPTWSPAGKTLEVIDILGQGSSSIVFSVQDPRHPSHAPLAAKWDRRSNRLASSPGLKDAIVLRDLNRRGPCSGVPQLIDECHDGTLLMSPVGQARHNTIMCTHMYRLCDV